MKLLSAAILSMIIGGYVQSISWLSILHPIAYIFSIGGALVLVIWALQVARIKI